MLSGSSKTLLQILRAAGPQGLSSVGLIAQYGYEDDLEISIYAKELLADGEPIGVSCCEERWEYLGYSAAPLRLWYADTPGQLDGVREMLADEIAALEAILAGVEEARDQTVEMEYDERATR
jgi:hypothetical protein